MNIRDANFKDYQNLVDLNNHEIPNVSSLNKSSLDLLGKESVFFKVVESDEKKISGFILALDQNSSYQSLNYKWFKERYEKFVYIDRVVIAQSSKSKGFGKLLYSHLEERLINIFPCLTCEVNLEPPNPSSLSFHYKRGFVDVGTQVFDDGKKVVMLYKSLL